jgi:hypothetical protein
MVRPDIKSDECPDLDTECEIKGIEIRPNDKDQILIGSFCHTVIFRHCYMLGPGLVIKCI